jgi:putative oxidoreductase
MYALLNRLRPYVLSVMRLIIGALMLCHGADKIFGGIISGKQMALPPLLITGGWIEFIGGSLVALGFLTRPAAFVISGQMAVAYFMAHAKNGFFPLSNGGELAVAYCFVYLYLVCSGGGAWSLDALLIERRRHD